MIEAIVVALIAGAASIATSVVTNRKTQALISYRMDQVEKKVGVHNGFEGRIIKLEDSVEELKKDVSKIESKLNERR